MTSRKTRTRARTAGADASTAWSNFFLIRERNCEDKRKPQRNSEDHPLSLAESPAAESLESDHQRKASRALVHDAEEARAEERRPLGLRRISGEGAGRQVWRQIGGDSHVQ